MGGPAALPSRARAANGPRIVIVGGGIAGLALAHALKERLATLRGSPAGETELVVLERPKLLGQHALGNPRHPPPQLPKPLGAGLQVGLRFTPATLRTARALLPGVLACIAGLIVACAGLAWLLREMTGVSMLDAYLATTPGGLYAVLATAFGSGANTTFVLAVQALRLLVMVLAAPLVVRALLRGSGLPSEACEQRSMSSACR